MPKWLTRIPNAAMLDRHWVRKTFFLSGEDVERSDFRLATQASQKFTDSRLGGNWTINNPPQFTRYADPRESGLNSKNDWYVHSEGNYLGMGHYYSEAIDDTRQEIAMQFGVPQYNGMLTFFTGFYDNEASVMANEGLGVIGYYIGRIAGFIVGLPFLPLIMIGDAVRFFLTRPSSKYYYMRETMPLYWNRVNVIANGIAVNMGLVPKVFGALKPTDGATPTPIGEEDEDRPEEYRAYFANAAQDIFLKGGGIDVYALANKTQRMADRRFLALQNHLKNGETEDEVQIMNRLKDQHAFDKFQDPGPDNPGLKPGEENTRGIREHLSDFFENRQNLNGIGNAKQFQTDSRAQQDVSTLKAEQPAGGDAAQTSQNADAAKASTPNTTQRSRWVQGKEKLAVDAIKNPDIPGSAGDYQQTIEYGKGKPDDTSFMEYYMADRRDGSKFVRFRVDYGGSVSESFSNSTGDSGIQGTINSTSSSARSARFTFSDGNTGVGPVDALLNGVKGLIAGGLDSLQVSGLMSLAGSAFVDIPKVWQGSSANLPSASYTIELRSPYGNHMSRFINLYVPLACLLAGVLPLSTGKQSYTSPFLCQLWQRGRVQTRLGMIDSLSITRGAGGLGWNNNNECLAIDVSFSVTDLSSIMHAPIDTGFSIFRPWRGLLQDNDDPFNDYMAVLGNLSMADQIYTLRKLILNLTRKSNQIDAYFTKAHAASMLDEAWPTRWVGQTISAFVRASEGTIPTVK